MGKTIEAKPKLTTRIKNFTNSHKLLMMGIIFGFIVISWQGVKRTQNSGEVTYETATAEKSTLISSISGSGTITSGNSTNVTTKTSGTVKTVYVVNGATVTQGQKIAQVELDDYATDRQAQAWKTYLDAKEAVATAKKNKISTDVAMWQAQDDILKAEANIESKNIDKTNPATGQDYTEAEKTIIDKSLEEARAAFSEAELKYQNADSEISAANTNVNSSWRDYSENSATITAPAAGVISDLNLASGLVVAASSTTSNTSGATIISSQTVAKISDPNSQLLASVSLSEVDIISVKPDQKVTLTLDAYPDMTFTGKVLGVNTTGTVNSGVTSYPVTILLDQTDTDIFPNMAVSAEIITNIVNDVILIPTTAITTTDEVSTVRVKKGEQISLVAVELGSANDLETEIKSGLTVGDEVITSVINSSASQTQSTTSPFSGFGRTGTNTGSRNSGVMIQGGPPPGGF